MRFITANDISLRDLHAMAHGAMEDTISDLDFFETLAAHYCFIVNGWVTRAGVDGTLHRVTRVIYNEDAPADKARMLVATARQLRRNTTLHFGGRFSS